MSTKHAKVRKRPINFAPKGESAIWQEQACSPNPYLAKKCLCHGYDLMELLSRRSFTDVWFLLFKGELPTTDEAKILEVLMISMINPGPRHPATRAGMNAAVSRTNTANILPISLAVLSGEHLGGNEVIASMKFFQNNSSKDAEIVAETLLQNKNPQHQGDIHITPGFGTRFGGIDPIPQRIASSLGNLPGAGNNVHWGNTLASCLEEQRMGWLTPGVCAAVFCDLGLPARYGAGLFQLLCAPGLLAHGLELADKPITTMPFLDEKHYVIDDSAKTKKE